MRRRALRPPPSPISHVPTYDFRCLKGHDFERFFRTMSSALAEVECPECGAPAQRLVSGGAGLLFKGSGFYLTDYGKNAHRPTAGKPEAGGAEPSSGQGGSDAASAAPEKTEQAKTDKPAPAAKPEAKPEAGAKPGKKKAE